MIETIEITCTIPYGTLVPVLVPAGTVPYGTELLKNVFIESSDCFF